MEGFQRFIAMGTLGMDPELKQIKDNMKVANFSLAINESRKNPSSGEKVTNTTWLNVEVWNQTAEFASNYLKKGSNVLIEGKIKIENSKDESGAYKSYTKLVAENFKIVSSPSNGQGSNNSNQNSNGNYVGVAPQNQQNGYPNNNVQQNGYQNQNVQQQGYQQQNFNQQQNHSQNGYQNQQGYQQQKQNVEAGVNNYMGNGNGFQIPVDDTLPF